jgi:hypothetical protein
VGGFLAVKNAQNPWYDWFSGVFDWLPPFFKFGRIPGGQKCREPLLLLDLQDV